MFGSIGRLADSRLNRIRDIGGDFVRDVSATPLIAAYNERGV